MKTIIAILIVSNLVFLVLAIKMWQRVDQIETALGGPDRIKCNKYLAIKQVEPSVVRIIGGEGEGSGFVIDANRILTNHHVIASEPSPKIIYSDGTVVNGEVTAISESLDLAIIRANHESPVLSWKTEKAEVGEEVLEFGYPYGGEISGSMTTNNAFVAAFRSQESNGQPQLYIQTSGGMLQGMSGGPTTDLCGKVTGINVAGSESMGILIDPREARDFISAANFNPEGYKKGITAIDFKPDESPIETIKAYYNYLKIRNFEEAYNLLSEHFIGIVSFEDWQKGFVYQLDTSIYSIKSDPKNPSRVFVELGSTDFVEGEFVYQYFKGSWLVKKIDGHYKLWESNIEKLEYPQY